MSGPPHDPLLQDPRVREAAARVVRERRAKREAWRRDPLAFRMDCRTVGAGLRYRDAYLPWQEEHLFLPMDLGKSIWCEAPRGHDRTDAEGWTVCRDLQYGPGGQRIVIAAADRDQARFPLERAARYLAERPDVFPDLDVQRNEILGPRGSKAIVLSSDIASSLGEKPTCVYLEELAAWPEKGRRLKDSIVGACTKLAAPLRILTNAGAGRYGNWRWEFREWFREMAQRRPERYHFWSAPSWVAEWARPTMQELRGAMSPAEARRFLDNVWLEQDEHPAFSSEDIEAALALDYRTDGGSVFVEGETPRRIVSWVSAADFGLTGDALCIGALALCEDGSVWLFDDLAIAGRPGSPASIVAAERHLLEIAERRSILATVFDPTEAQGTIQRIGFRVSAEGERWSTTLKVRLYRSILGKMRARKFHARPEAFGRLHRNGVRYDLRREMTEAVEKVTASGSYLMHPDGGHDDGLAVCQMASLRLGECSLQPAAVYVSPNLSVSEHRGWRPWRRNLRDTLAAQRARRGIMEQRGWSTF